MRQFALAVLLSAPVWATTSLGTPLPDTTNSPFEFDYTTWGWYASTVVLSTTIWAPLSYNDNYSLRTTGTFWDIVKVTSPTEPAYTCSSRFLMSGSTSMTCTSGFPCTTALLYSSLGAAEALTQFECGSTGRTIYRVSPTSGKLFTCFASSFL
ncbi:hypothetical protein K458DRAFT_39659 [Lentithecium fluviatile CBS 122367]|uniref:AA1-like domain-containing protein n=1 Tax=Lentithecium fluviatile CBS 122367 TaxID=1168545 RepID=A0A6G1IZ89_9PLEO|nr:hypothetical protein K458DRAFT_39659 [Lentithecium fluviatile CBS 122367]